MYIHFSHSLAFSHLLAQVSSSASKSTMHTALPRILLGAGGGRLGAGRSSPFAFAEVGARRWTIIRVFLQVHWKC
ncbi:hypothetical protein EJ02DRAFT_199992 [Clathrospora elynae]|uniref:Uncharacterized protein n=1 Tax=Clathrospora elynae TaxID=706981 RepID=A0A6A5T1T2_9PLEO|nr:hypothetical protein EJ02DRAFT_199992 [Clathrospora elynae]